MSLFAAWAGAASLAAPFLRLALALRVRRGKELADRLPERRGLEVAPRPEGRLLWLHAASVGETVSILPVVAELLREAPRATVLLTTGTVTSARLLAQRSPDLGSDAARVLHRFAPLDVPAWVARFLDHWRPDAAGFVESELWPNTVAACRSREIPMMLLNARLSPRSFRRWRRAPSFAAALLAGFARIEAQSQADADRLRRLGARDVEHVGNLKFAAPCLPVDRSELDRLRALLGARPLWLAASTHRGEEVVVCAAHRALAKTYPNLLTIIVPRHPERGASIAEQAEGFAVARRAAGQEPPDAGVWVADTLGELGLFYRLSPIAFVGRSLVAPGGGQNPLEAARLGCPVAVGPYIGNFLDAADALRQAGALADIADAATLASWAHAMLSDAGKRARAGRAGISAAKAFADLPARVARTFLQLATAA